MRCLSSRYELDSDTVVSQWQLSHQFISCDPDNVQLMHIYRQLPKEYAALRHLYKVLITLPITTASVERSFSKLSIVKSKLRSTMSQERVEALLLASVENDLLQDLKDSELVSIFAAKADRKGRKLQL